MQARVTDLAGFGLNLTPQAAGRCLLIEDWVGGGFQCNGGDARTQDEEASGDSGPGEHGDHKRRHKQKQHRQSNGEQKQQRIGRQRYLLVSSAGTSWPMKGMTAISTAQEISSGRLCQARLFASESPISAKIAGSRGST